MVHVRIGFTASEEMSFKNVDAEGTTTDNGRATDAWLYYKPSYKSSAQMSITTTCIERTGRFARIRHILVCKRNIRTTNFEILIGTSFSQIYNF